MIMFVMGEGGARVFRSRATRAGSVAGVTLSQGWKQAFSPHLPRKIFILSPPCWQVWRGDVIIITTLDMIGQPVVWTNSRIWTRGGIPGPDQGST